jgi:hypothetical protein
MNIKEIIATINQMQADGVIGRYAIGGAVGAALYRVEVDSTDDVDGRGWIWFSSSQCVG